MKSRHLILFAGFVLVVALVTGPACATKKFVKTESATLDQKITEVSNDVEANQKRLSEHDEKLATIGSLISQQDGQIKAVDGKVEEVKTLIKGNLVLARFREQGRLHRDPGPHRQHRHRRGEHGCGPEAGRSGHDVPLQAVPHPASPHVGRQPGQLDAHLRQRDARRPVPEPPRRDPGLRIRDPTPSLTAGGRAGDGLPPDDHLAVAVAAGPSRFRPLTPTTS